MWTLKKLLYRCAHFAMGIAFKRINVPIPELLSGPGSIRQLPGIIQETAATKLLLVTDKGISSIGLAGDLLEDLSNTNLSCTVFDDVQPNPSIANVEAGLKVYLDEQCDGIIAFGGGSAMDCAKLIGARAANPDIAVLAMSGGFKVKNALPPLFAVPTTAGTGSECTLAAVITNPDVREKFAVASDKIVPAYAVLDPQLMVSLPPHITAHTGMDALTHAIEAYVGKTGTPFTDEHAEQAVKIIFADLEQVFADGSDLEKRSNLAYASYCAGLAFTRALVGYVHAIAHNLGGLYGVPHGLANAIVLPYILEFSREDCETKLARLAVVGGLGDPQESDRELSHRLIEKIRSMNETMGIPTRVAEIQTSDIPLIARRALAEGNPGYPVPRLMNQDQCEALLRQLI